MRCKVHVLDTLTGEMLSAMFTTEIGSTGRPVVVLDDGEVIRPASQSIRAWRFEVLPFPLADELGASSFDGGTP